MELASIHRARRPGRLIMAAPSYLFTIGRVAEMLGEDEQWLQTIADDMEPEDGCLTVCGTTDLSTTALRANEDETSSPENLDLGARKDHQSCPCSRDRSKQRRVTARTEAVGRRSCRRRPLHHRNCRRGRADNSGDAAAGADTD